MGGAARETGAKLRPLLTELIGARPIAAVVMIVAAIRVITQTDRAAR